MQKHRDPEKPVGHNAKRISASDGEYVLNVLLAILTDSLTLCSSYKFADYTRDCATLKNRIVAEGTSFATLVLPQFFTEFLFQLEGGRPHYRMFRKSSVDGRPVFLHRLTIAVLDDLDDSTEAMRCIYALCHAFKKLKGPYSNTVLRKELRSFVETDRAVARCDFNSPDLRPIVDYARILIGTIFPYEHEPQFIPRPGPGATNSPLKKHMRFEPHVVYSQLDAVFPADEWFYSSLWDTVTRAQEWSELTSADHPTSRFKFVHKYKGKPRGICIEENETQYLQQGIKRYMYQAIEAHPATRGRVNFTLQSVNRRLAWQSSVDKSMSTIDMSAASDRVGRELVLSLFRDSCLLEPLDAVSTRIINLPDGLGVDTELIAGKFAPMGSGVCFPVMAIVHWALIRSVIANRPGFTVKDAKQVFVYGDDILVPAQHHDYVCTVIERFGMKINVDKSYVRSSFRESCGFHAYNGVEVTPVYNNYTLTTKTKVTDSNVLLSSIAKEYEYHRRGFAATARVIRVHTQVVYGQLPYGSLNTGLLAFKRSYDPEFAMRQKLMAKRVRYNRSGNRKQNDYQSPEYLLRVVIPRYTEGNDVEGSRGYLRTLLSCANEDACHFAGSVETMKIAYRWVLESALG